MASQVTAQEKLVGGSFVLATVTEGHLEKGVMYRVKNTKQEGKYIILDELFCGTEELKNKTLTFQNRFTLMAEQDVKDRFKLLLSERMFDTGQEFFDVRTDEVTIVTNDSRTHILAKFGKFMGVKIAGGHVWFAGKSWAKAMVDLKSETRPEPTDSEPEPEAKEVPLDFYVLCETKSEAISICNRYGVDDPDKWLEYWNVYEDKTCYRINKVTQRIGSYTTLLRAEEVNEYPIYTYDRWNRETNPTKSQTKQRKSVDMMKGSIESQILAVVDEHLDTKETRLHISNAVEKLLNEWGIDKNVRQLEVSVNGAPPVRVGKIHYKYDLVLKCMMARTNVALVGAAGSGKTTTVAKAAEALKLKFYSKSVSAQTGAHEFFGYQDAQGRYVRTLFREAYENGGVFLLDEFDAGNPNVLAALNQATANEHCAFADDMIPKHKDFICVMAGNTFGHGANSEYVGRNKIDAATLDRFAFIDFPYDEDLEHALAPNKGWCKKVQAFRKKVVDKKIRTVISPRATIIGGQLLANGVTELEVMELVIFKGLNQEERNLLK